MAFTEVPRDPDLVKGEEQILDFWDQGRFFDALRQRNAGGPKWSFIDGPITANNPMGVHHAWGRTYKDAFQRFFAMRGYDQRWQNGFDCQGLWVEVSVERDKGFTNKKDIEDFGVENFINECKQRVLRYADVITQQSIRLGMWMDWDNSYFTMSDENNYAIWAFLKKCHQRGFIYKGLDSMPWCPRCGTGISEQERREGYQEIEDESVYLRFPLTEREGESLLVWTTTPWTLAANVAAAVNPNLTYVKARVAGDVFYVAEGRLGVLGEDAEVLERLEGTDLEGWKYTGPFDELPAASEAAKAHRVVLFNEVTADEGTGIVHIAPGCGREDFQLGKELGLPLVAPIDESGRYTDGFGSFTGKHASEVPRDVYRALREKNLFFKSERYLHDYPHCWRCDTPLLFRAVDEWYIQMDWRDEIAEMARKVKWVPEYGLDQELDWLRNMGDWMISKKRYWGLALPIWECSECGWFDVVGGRDELAERAVQGWDSFDGNSPHRPWVDSVKIRCEQCGHEAARVPDVGNPWLDAGIVPYSTLNYSDDPHRWSKWVPADFVVESFPGQFRNWFYALLAMSTMIENIPPYRTVLGHGLVKDEKGEEFSKSKYSIDFNEAAEKMGVDVMRWMYCRHNPTLNLNFGYRAGKEIERKVFRTLWNSYLFFTNYAILDQFDPSSPRVPVDERPEIDRWILSSLTRLVKMAHEQFPQYWLPPFIRQAETFIDELSNWYIRRNRQRFWDPRGKDETSKAAAYQTLYEVLVTLAKTLAPIAPFLTERLYQNLVVSVDPKAPPSVHLAPYPDPDESLLDETLDADMELALRVVRAAHSLREEAGHRVRQPLAELRVGGVSDLGASALARLNTHIIEELNVKKVTVSESLSKMTRPVASPNFASLGPKFGKQSQAVGGYLRQAPEDVVRKLASGTNVTVNIAEKDYEIGPADVSVHLDTVPGWLVGEAGNLQVALDTELDDELIREGLARDVVRHIQNVRKELGLKISDRVEVQWWSDDELLSHSITEHIDYLRGEVQANTFSLSNSSSGLEEVAIGERTFLLKVRKAG